jgi:hypothetical protein
MNPQPRPPGAARRTAELTVAGPLGPILRAAFPDQHITQQECTVIRTGPATDHDLTDLVHALVEHGLEVQSVHRLTDP